MTNSLDRLIDGMIATLTADVIPRLDDEFARGQAYGVVDLLQNLRPRIDWALGPVAAQAAAHARLVERLARLFPDAGPRPPSPPVTVALPRLAAGDLARIRDALDGHVCAVIDWLAEHRDAVVAAAVADAERAVRDYIHEQLAREATMTARPLFAEIARGAPVTVEGPQPC